MPREPLKGGDAIYRGCTTEYHDEVRNGSIENFRKLTVFKWVEEHPFEIVDSEVFEASHWEYGNCIFCLGTLGYDLLRLEKEKEPK